MRQLYSVQYHYTKLNSDTYKTNAIYIYIHTVTRVYHMACSKKGQPTNLYTLYIVYTHVTVTVHTYYYTHTLFSHTVRVPCTCQPTPQTILRSLEQSFPGRRGQRIGFDLARFRSSPSPPLSLSLARLSLCVSDSDPFHSPTLSVPLCVSLRPRWAERIGLKSLRC